MQASSLNTKSQEIQSTKKKTFLDKILRGPLGKVRAYKASSSNRNTSWDHVAANGSPPAYPLYFVSHRPTVFLCSEPFQNCTNTNIEEAQNRHNFDFKPTGNRCLCLKKWITVSAELVSWSSWGGVEIQDGGRPPWIRSESVVKLTLSGQISNLNVHIGSSVRFILGLILQKKNDLSGLERLLHLR